MLLAITGGTGFVGGAVLDRLAGSDVVVRALARQSQPERDGVEWVKGSLNDHAALADLCLGADAVLHIAGVVNAPDAAGFVAGNVAGTAAILGAAESALVPHFIHVSSLAATRPELSDYGASKAKAETLVSASKCDWTMLRPPGIFGPGDTELRDMFRAARAGFVPLPPAGRASWIYVDDLARLLIALVKQPGGKQIWEADDGHPDGWSHREFAAAIGHAVDRTPLMLDMPAALLRVAARVDRLLRRDAAKLTPDRAAYMSHPDWTIDPRRRPPAGIWQPQIDTAQGLAETARWYRARGLL